VTNRKLRDESLTPDEFQLVCEALAYGMLDLHACNCGLKEMILDDLEAEFEMIDEEHPAVDVAVLREKVLNMSSPGIGTLIEKCNVVFHARELDNIVE
jgi:hypothetical protein